MAAGADAATATEPRLRGAVRDGAAAGGDGVVRRHLPAARDPVPRADSARAADEAARRRRASSWRRTEAAVNWKLRSRCQPELPRIGSCSIGRSVRIVPCTELRALSAQAPSRSACCPPVLSRMARRRSRRRAARGIRPEIVDQALATVDEPLPSSSSAIGRRPKRPVARDVHLPSADAEGHSDRAGDVRAAPQSRSTKSAERYGVSPRIIVAIWGLESNFGQFSGVRPTIGGAGDARLGSAALDVLPRRAVRTRSRFSIAATSTSRSMRGSWAGAMGQPQFMPSSYLKYAEDFDDDGRARHLVVARRRLRVDCELPEGARLDRQDRTGDAR